MVPVAVAPGDGCREQGIDIRCALLAHREGGQCWLSGPGVGAIPSLRPDLTTCGPFHVRPPCPHQLGSAGAKLNTSVSPNPAHGRLPGSQLLQDTGGSRPPLAPETRRPHLTEAWNPGGRKQGAGTQLTGGQGGGNRQQFSYQNHPEQSGFRVIAVLCIPGCCESWT